MAARRFDGIVDAEQPCSSQTDNIALNAGLRNQELKCCSRSPSHFSFACFRSGSVQASGAPAFAISAVIDSKCVDSGGCRLPGYLIPRLAWPVTLVE